MEICESEEGFEFRSGDVIVSKLIREPGPTNTMLDVLAAAIATFAGSDPVVILGFAAGGVIAPLRALGFSGPVLGIDNDPRGAKIFATVARAWQGEFEFIEEDATRWLERTADEPGVIVDDLSIIENGDVIKPWECLVAIPQLAARALGECGIYISNALPAPGMPLRALEGNIAQPFPEARSVRSTEYENSILLGGEALPSADEVESHLVELLEALDSSQATAIEEVRTLF